MPSAVGIGTREVSTESLAAAVHRFVSWSWSCTVRMISHLCATLNSWPIAPPLWPMI